MSFHLPMVLAATVAAIVPLVLHWLNRSAYQSIEWGAMMFLEHGGRRRQHVAHLKMATLLLLRMVVMALLAAALAGPFVAAPTLGRGGASALSAGRGPNAAIILLDRSGSMNVEENGRSRFDAARDWAGQILALHKGEPISLITLGDGPKAAAWSNEAELSRRLADMKPTSGLADVARGLDRALELLEQSGVQPGGGPALRADIYLISDRQAASWATADASWALQWRKRASELAAASHLLVMSVPGGAVDDVCIEDMEPAHAWCGVDQATEVLVRVCNHGDSQRQAVAVFLGDNRRKAALVNLAPGAAATVRLPLIPSALGTQVVTAETDGPGPAFAHRRDLALTVAEPIRVLLVSGDQRQAGQRRSEEFIRLALGPHNLPRRDGFVVEDIAVEDFSGEELGRCQVAILANLASLAPSQRRALRQFIYDGGGVFLAPGDQSGVHDYNRDLLGEGADSILPVELAPPNAGATTALASFDLNHPIFQFLRGRPDPVPPATVRQYFPCKVMGRAQVLARYAGEMPFLVTAATGRGRVLLVTTSLDADSSSLPLTAFFVPFIQSAVRYLSGPAPLRNLEPGDPLVAAFEGVLDQSSIVINDRPPAPASLSVTPLGRRTEIGYTDTFVPGRYVLRARVDEQWRQTVFVVQWPAREADLRPLNAKQWRSLEDALGFQTLEPSGASLAPTIRAMRYGRELWPAFIGAVMLLAVLEFLAARAWSHRPD